MPSTTTKEILAKLKLDSKEFVGKLDESHKSILKLTAGMTAVSAAVIAAAKFTANYRDETIKAARAAGSTAEDFSALRHAAELSAVPFETLKKSLQYLNKPSAEAKDAMARLGVSLVDASGKARTQNDVLNQVADGMKNLSSPAQKSAAAIAIFGNRGASMVNMLSGGSEGLKTMTDEAIRMGITFDEKAGVASELFNDNITRLTGSVKGLVMNLSESVIELVNTSGIMDTLAKAVQGVTGWWKSLDDSTKNTITTIGAVVAGVAAFILAAAGIIAIAPAVTAAITAMTGGLNLVVLGIAAAVAAFAAIATGAITYWDQVKTAVEPALQSIRDAVNDLGNAVQPIADILSAAGEAISNAFGGISTDFMSWLGITDDMTGKISVLGTVSKVVFAGIGSAIVVVIGVFQTLNNTIQLIATSIEQLGVAFYDAIINQNFDAASQALSKIRDSAQKLKDDFVGIGDKIKQSFSNIVVTVDASAARKSIGDIGYDLNRLSGADGGEPAWIKSMKKYVGSIGGVVQQLGGMLGQLSDMIAAPIEAAIARTNRNFDILSGNYSQMMEKMLEDTESAEDEKISRLSEKYDQQIAALSDAEQRKNDILQFAANERLLLMDEEYQTAKDLAEQQFQEKMEIDAANYELEKEVLLQKAIDKEQRAITEEIMDNDFKLYMENQQALHDQKMEQMAKDYTTKTKAEDTALKTTLAANEELSKNTIQALTEQKNADLEKAEEQKNAKLKALEEKKQRDEKLLKKAQIFMNWKAEQSEFKSTQGMKIAQTVVSGVAGAAQAFAMAAGTIPIVGIILGAVLAASVLAMTFASVAQMAMQQPPSAPAALFLATGGVMDGPSHAAGGIYANLEGGEGVIDKARTEKLIDSVDEATSPRGLQIIFQPGSIVNNGEAVDDSMIDKISYAISRRLERQGVYA